MHAYNEKMRAIFVVLFITAVVGLFCFVLKPGLDQSKIFELFSLLTGTSQSVEKERLVPFVPAKGNFRVSFPGKPGEMNMNNAWLRQSPLPLPHFFVGDKDLGFYASQWTENVNASNLNTDLAAKGNSQPLALSFAMAQSGAATEQSQGLSNNDLVTRTQAYEGPDPIQIQNFLDTQCELIVNRSGGKISSKTPSSAGGGRYPGRIVDGTFKNTANAFRLHLYLDQQNNRLFCVCVVGKPKRVFSAQATHFLNSLDIWS